MTLHFFREVDPAGYKYFLEAPISTTQKIEQDRMTYLNKGKTKAYIKYSKHLDYTYMYDKNISISQHGQKCT